MSEKNTNNFFIGNFTFLTQLCDFLLCFDLLFLMKEKTCYYHLKGNVIILQLYINFLEEKNTNC
jgi:hypothetical protein